MKIPHKIQQLSKKIAEIQIPTNIWVIIAVFSLVTIPVFTLHNTPVIGVYATALATVILASMSLLYEPAKKIAIVAAAMLVALMLPMSMQNISSFVKTGCLYGALLLLALVYRYLFMQDQPDKAAAITPHGWRGYITQLPQGLVVGQILGGLAFVLLAHNRPFADISVGLLLGASVVFAMIEVMYFQGLLQSTLLELTSGRIALATTAVFYVCLSATVSWQTLAVNTISGVAFAWMFYLKQNTLPVMFANATMKLVFIGLVIVVGR